MKHIKFFAFYGIVIFALFLTACNMEWQDESFAPHLQGTWVSDGQGVVLTGALDITFDRITITGYERSQMPEGANIEQLPFRNFLRGIALSGYSEEHSTINDNVIEGHIFIEDAGVFRAVFYRYWYITPPPDFQQVHFLRFSFGGAYETLRRVE
ncbi:MAG: hypothetical protein FWD87_04385 [Spirochaetaceae bacterium]|nr:hypothetical protein [Spirochaetaceae bacterium]